MRAAVAPKQITRKLTADGKTVVVYEDGDLTAAMGFYFKGARVQKNVSLSLLIAEEACLFDASEMGALIRAANIVAKKGGNVLPGDVRALAHKLLKKD